jgi:hypothetical protein
MATKKQRETARKNVKKAQGAARKKRTIAKLSSRTRRDLGREALLGMRRRPRPSGLAGLPR